MGAVDEVDVAVVGAGPAGATTALILARAGCHVALLDRGPGPGAAIGDSLAPRARATLRALGVWDEFVADDHLPCYGNRSWWGSNEPAERSHIFDPHGHGWHLDRPKFDAMLVRAALRAGATWWHRTRLTATAESAVGWNLTVRQDGASTRTCQVHATFVVDASGRRAVFARAQGTRRRRHDRLVGVATVYQSPDPVPSDLITMVEPTANGWWYSARLPGRRTLAVLMTDADLLPSSREVADRGTGRVLVPPEHTSSRLAGQRHCLPPVFASASSGIGDSIVGRHWVAVGDAAATYDPLSAQGISTALEDGHRAACAIVDSLGGRSASLADYAELVRGRFRTYLATRCAYYGLEQRWPSSPFWRRRVGGEHTNTTRGSR